MTSTADNMPRFKGLAKLHFEQLDNKISSVNLATLSSIPF